MKSRADEYTVGKAARMYSSLQTDGEQQYGHQGLFLIASCCSTHAQPSIFVTFLISAVLVTYSHLLYVATVSVC